MTRTISNNLISLSPTNKYAAHAMIMYILAGGIVLYDGDDVPFGVSGLEAAPGVVKFDIAASHRRCDDAASVHEACCLKLRCALPFHQYRIRRGLKRHIIHECHSSVFAWLKDYNASQNKRVPVILAPTGSGKSFYARSHSSVVDADGLIKWPKDPMWWVDAKQRELVGADVWRQVSRFETDRVVLFNGNPDQIPSDALQRIHIIGLVVISWGQHLRNLDTRAEAGSTQPTDPDLVAENVANLRNYALRNGVPLYGSFDDAVHTYDPDVDRVHGLRVFTGSELPITGFRSGINFVFHPHGGVGEQIEAWQHANGLKGHSIFDTHVDATTVFIDGNKWVGHSPARPNTPVKTLSHLTYLYTHALEYSLSTTRVVVFYSPDKLVLRLAKAGSMYWTPVLPPDGRVLPGGDMGVTFGTEVSIYASNSDAAVKLGLTDIMWKHNIRCVPVIIILGMMRRTGLLRPDVETVLLQDYGVTTGVVLKRGGVEYNTHTSGHMFNALRSILFRSDDDKRYTPDWFATIHRMLRNQHVDTNSLEPTFRGVAYHSWLETAAAVMASVIHALLHLRSGGTVKKSSFVLWRIMCGKVLKMVSINKRTSIFALRDGLREKDPRYGSVYM